MNATIKLDAAAEVLRRLEQHLEVPYISGDLRDWSEELRQLLRETSERVRAEMETEHGSAFEAIVKNHGNLTQEVEKMRAEDPEIVAALDAVRQQAHQFSAGVDETEQAGQQFRAKRERLVNDGLALVLKIRRQRAAISTWLGEALQRDNGVGD